jgi:ribose-phosphate pyrophosphokinase
MMEQGATSVRAVCTHAVFSGNAKEKLENSSLKEIIVSDTIPQEGGGKLSVLSTAGVFADVIDRIHKYESISEHFKFTTIL